MAKSKVATEAELIMTNPAETCRPELETQEVLQVKVMERKTNRALNLRKE